MRTEAPLLAPIFRSDGRARLLSTLVLTGDELSVTDLAKRAGLAYPIVHREVARLVDAGILSERQVGRTRLSRAIDESPLVGPLREILTVATGPVVMLAGELGRIAGIEAAFVYGSFAARMLGDAGPSPHDIDVMVLGEPHVDAVDEACTRLEAAVHRPVNVVPAAGQTESPAATDGEQRQPNPDSRVRRDGTAPPEDAVGRRPPRVGRRWCPRGRATRFGDGAGCRPTDRSVRRVWGRALLPRSA